MNRQTLISEIRKKESFLCIGLDPDLDKLPSHLPKNAEGVKEFCSQIIEHTKDSCVAYKLNSAFFESLGWRGFKVMEEIFASIPTSHFIIADAKRGDIGNTSIQYAKAFLETMKADALTISPYMGSDSVQPFLTIQDKWAIILGLTSNKGSQDFELLKVADEYLYEFVMKKCALWGNDENTMFVIGATQSENMARIRTMLPTHFFLVPGVGAQGGSLENVCANLMNKDVGILVNSSREIIYASSSQDYAIRASDKAIEIREKMKSFL
jgi:orotidine-5'-phosphate decarboxylase